MEEGKKMEEEGKEEEQKEVQVLEFDLEFFKKTAYLETSLRSHLREEEVLIFCDGCNQKIDEKQRYHCYDCINFDL